MMFHAKNLTSGEEVQSGTSCCERVNGESDSRIRVPVLPRCTQAVSKGDCSSSDRSSALSTGRNEPSVNFGPESADGEDKGLLE